MAEDRGFEVVDKRRAAESGAAAAEAETDVVSDGAEADGIEEEEEYGAEGEDGGFQNPLAGMNVANILRMSAGLLNERAWVGMGLVPDPLTGQINKDLTEAKRAIDILTDLVKHLEQDAAPDERREIQTMLTNLRLNFVRQSS
jgi:hypothetical protein